MYLYLKNLIQEHILQPHLLLVFWAMLLLFALFSLNFLDSSFFYKSVLFLLYGLMCWFITRRRVAWIINALIVWVAFENLLIAHIQPDWFIYIKYIPEATMYMALFFTLVDSYGRGVLRWIKTPINFFLICFIFVALIGTFFKSDSVMIGLLGIRQLLRFVAIFYLVLYANLHREDYKKLWILIIGVAVFQILLGMAQYLSGGALDVYLLPQRNFFIADSILLEGVEQYWAAGERVFGTFRRYNELGAFLALIFSLAMAWLYEYGSGKLFFSRGKSNTINRAGIVSSNDGRSFKSSGVALNGKKFLPSDFWYKRSNLFFLLGFSGLILTVILTYARSTWIAVFVSLLIIGVFIKRDLRLMITGFIALLFVGGYLGVYLIGNRIRLDSITDQRSMNLAERILEPFSRTSLRGSYDGLGRLYFIVNTPKVVALSPIIGVGPGMYGGGVAAAFNNRSAYNQAGVAFGVYGETGQIDNNWFSIWGEFGTAGVVLFGIVFMRLWVGAYFIYKKRRDRLIRFFSLALMGAIGSAVVLGFFGPYFEIRTFALYFWLLAGTTFAIADLENQLKKSNLKNSSYENSLRK